MTATKTKSPPVYGDDLPITAYQIKEIRKLCQFNEDYKCEVVYEATGQTSLKKLTQKQAVSIINGFNPNRVLNPVRVGTENWGLFDKNNKQHLTVLAQMRTAQWVIPNDKYGEVPDLERLSEFLKSEKSPINKPLKKMEPWEVSKVIEAFKGIVKSKYK